MTDEELGFYVRCLNHAWVNSGLPASIDDIARSLRTPIDVVERHWVRVSKCFALVDGRHINKRQEEERSAAIAKSQKCKEAVQTRYVDSTSVSTSVERPNNVGSTDDLPRAYESESDSESSEKKEKLSAYESDDRFSEFEAAWREKCKDLPSDADLRDARIVWRGQDFHQRMDHVTRTRTHPGPFWGTPAKWISNKGWQRVPNPNAPISRPIAKLSAIDQMIEDAKALAAKGTR